ncbi:MAG: endonuclease domain-containing protein [Acidimicrobiia bacterium]
MKKCKRCGEVKPYSEFYRAPGCRDGHRSECKVCNLAARKAKYLENPAKEIARVREWRRKHRDQFQEYQRAYRARRPAELREGHLRRTFGITQGDYDAMLAAQGGGCAICGDAPADGKSFHVDHLGDQVRGILCVRCNNALGQLKERADLAEIAAAYLESGGFVPAGVSELHDLAVERVQGLRAA